MAASLEERVSILERDVTQLKARAATPETAMTEARLAAMESDLAAIPDLIKAESRLSDSRIARLRAEMNDRFSHMDDRFDAVIRAISEIVAERPRKA
jgi:hypothetical protein